MPGGIGAKHANQGQTTTLVGCGKQQFTRFAIIPNGVIRNLGMRKSRAGALAGESAR
jgi:hypothetical protein